MTPELDIEPDQILDIEPEPAAPPAAAAAPVAPAPLALAEVLPADFNLPALVEFVPDQTRRAHLDGIARDALAISVTGADGMQAADTALAGVRAAMKDVEAHFAEPVERANRLHKRLTGLRGEWLQLAGEAVAVVGRRIASEKARLDAIAAKERREAQALADQQAREAREREADAAQTQGAPAAVVTQMRQEAAVAKAAPVPVPAVAAPALAHTTVVKVWKARIVGTPADAPATPATAELTPAQVGEVKKLLADIIAGTQPITLIELAWPLITARAKAEKGTLAITGIEAFEDQGTRSKPGRRL